MRFNLKHWFIMMFLTDGILTVIFRRALFNEEDDIIMSLMFVFMPCLVTVLMFMVDFMGCENEKEWAKKAKEYEDIKRTAIKIIDIDDGRQVVFLKDMVRIYSEDKIHFTAVSVNNVKYLAEVVQELGL